ncbi:diguanylate cyclase (GGDEF) domain-containing protein [Quadrisphaera granulorum]|uniref:Diguanylate cyclase (GGDEF)-like protein n=1 Tax=Quadrisphaera granulorum TaxID=317664 RepID=A0A316B1D1_9ACTN|nr:GGDEF domain-containing protein [Quadrisphaera granulorum]PWJ56337.1 diguanylate cyclase (GGDEF)-like protein [Quadrisphaera granulorum]SZE94971.1 diguanylate cyclase (GGDEF) domain-containing protein [Quadrisphaera granulorum]
MKQHLTSRTIEVTAATTCAIAVGAAPLLPVGPVLGVVIAILPLLVLLVLAVRHRLWWVAAAAALLTCSNAIFHVLWWQHGAPVLPSLSDVFSVLGYLALARAAWVAAGPAGREASFDALLVVLGPAVVIVAAIAPPVVTNGPSLAGALTIAYPVLDLVMLLAVVRAVLVGALSRGQAVALQAGSALLLFANAGYVALLAWAPHAMTHWMAAPFGLAWALTAVAVALDGSGGRPARPVPARRRRVRSRVVLVLLPASACLPSAALVAQGLAGWDVDWRVLGTGAMLTAVLSTVRLHGALRTAAEQAAELERLAHVDELTGLPNRRACTAALEELAVTGTGSVALALLDLDRFKCVNDAQGHAAGDALLRDAAHAWLAALPGTADLYRWGGEEFVVLLRGASPEVARAVLEDVRLATPTPHTVSGGLVGQRPGEDSASALVRADALLYRAKEGGRNRICDDATERPADATTAGAPGPDAPAVVAGR